MRKIDSPLYGWVVDRAEHGAAVRVNFKERKLFVDGQQIELDSSTPMGIDEPESLDAWVEQVEDLYDDYKYSRPSDMTEHRTRKKHYFRALTLDQLTEELGHDALCSPFDRAVAETRLNVYILLTLVAGMWKLEDLFSKDWFFQGRDKTLIIRKDMF